MKIYQRALMLVIAFASFSLGSTQAAENKIQILNDREMAAVEGGFCLIETCEPGQPSGNCQPIPDDYDHLCPAGTCTFIAIQTIFGEEDYCNAFGQYTCSGTDGYRQCITGELWDVCIYSSINICGYITQPVCVEGLQDHTCTCQVVSVNTPCDWTNCLLESQ